MNPTKSAPKFHSIRDVRVVWLEAFVTCIETGSYTRAAKVLGCSQPSVSRYIQHLQEAVGQVLITNYDLPVLTAEGEKFMRRARGALNWLKIVDANYQFFKQQAVELTPLGGAAHSGPTDANVE